MASENTRCGYVRQVAPGHGAVACYPPRGWAGLVEVRPPEAVPTQTLADTLTRDAPGFRLQIAVCLLLRTAPRPSPHAVVRVQVWWYRGIKRRVSQSPACPPALTHSAQL